MPRVGCFCFVSPSRSSYLVPAIQFGVPVSLVLSYYGTASRGRLHGAKALWQNRPSSVFVLSWITLGCSQSLNVESTDQSKPKGHTKVEGMHAQAASLTYNL